MRIGIGTKMAMGFALPLALTVAIAALGAWWLAQAAAITAQATQVDARKQALAIAWKSATEVNAMRTAAIVTDADPEAARAYFGPMVEATAKRIAALHKELESLVDTAEGKAVLERIGAARKAYLAARDETYAAMGTTDGKALLRDKLQPALDAYLGTMQGIVDRQDEVMRASGGAAVDYSNRGSRLLIGVAALAVILGALVAWRLSRSIVQPLARSVEVAEAIAQRDLTRQPAVDRADEIGALQRAVATMSARLREIVGEVSEAARQIGTASREIASGNADLSSRTEQQAGALQQTAASMQQLASTVRANAESARQATQLAHGASDVAQRGGALVTKAVDRMGEIARNARDIAEITSVIDGIAFQTNILALNAAVEAARAGEQGRGFAVVAGEVRALAQRSATAAREIKALIDRSVAGIEGGHGLVTQAGQAMQDVVASVTRVTDMIGEMSAATEEQSGGIQQANDAVGHIDRVTQQNAALVEQSAAAAQSMSAQAERLGGLLGGFRL